jgi:hypothetical protein
VDPNTGDVIWTTCWGFRSTVELGLGEAGVSVVDLEEDFSYSESGFFAAVPTSANVAIAWGSGTVTYTADHQSYSYDHPMQNS